VFGLVPALQASRVDLRNSFSQGGRGAEGGVRGRVRACLVAAEVSLALTARERLEADGTPTRVVSLPCLEWFHEQDDAYQQQVLPPNVKARVSIEAAVAQGWREIVGDAGEIVSINHFGASASGSVLMEQFGFTPDRVVAAAHATLDRVGKITGTTTGT